jgi:diaminopimelate decarboxylase
MPRSPSRSQIAGVAVTELAEAFGTPTYVYDAAVIAEQIASLRAFDVVRYAQKANSNLAVVDWCRRNGTLVDAVSAGEVLRALAAGYEPSGEPPPIVYTADIFDEEALELVVSRGIHVNCGSPDMIDQYGARAPGRAITLRINPGFGHGHSQKTNTGGEQSKHGIWYEELDLCVARAARYDLRISGIHVHIGSGTDYEHLAEVCGAVEGFAKQVGPQVTTISAGGGLPIAYREDDSEIDVDAYFAIWDGTRRHLAEQFGHPVGLEIEPGRYLVAEAGYLIAEIRAIKVMGKNTFYVLDAGFNNLARPILYGAYHPMSVAFRDGSPLAGLHPVVVGGPLCESGDIFTQEEGGFVRTEDLPYAKVGDYVVIECAGAYAFTMGSNYNSRGFAAEVLIKDGSPKLVRRRQSLTDLYRDEIIPEEEA